MSRNVITTIILLYVCYLIIPASTPFWYSQQYTYHPADVSCGYSTQMSLFSTILGDLQYSLPVFPILLSCFLSVYTLLRSRSNSAQHCILNRVKRESTITIICFTIVYAVFNIPVCTFCILDTIDFLSGWKYNFLSFDMPNLYLYNFINVDSVAINSAINPLLYLWRMKTLRRLCSVQIRNIIRIGRNNTINTSTCDQRSAACIVYHNDSTRESTSSNIF